MTSDVQARRLLGVGEDADAEDVRRAFRRLALTHHPDAGGDAAAFHRLQQAVETLLGAPDRTPERPAASPSRTGVRRPSTSVRVGATGWGESTSGPRWHDGEVAVDGVDWDRDLPTPPHPWSPELAAVAAARAGDDGPVRPVTGVSRRPGSNVNRLATWMASEFLARWWIRPSETRGIVGHDVEVRLELASRRARRLADATSWPTGWTRERRPSVTVVTLVLTPSRDARQTAMRATDALVEALQCLDWPLQDWLRLPGDR